MLAPNCAAGGAIVETACDCVRVYAAVTRSNNSDPISTRVRVSPATTSHLSIGTQYLTRIARV